MILVLFLAALIITALITLITYIFFKRGQNIIPWISRLKFLEVYLVGESWGSALGILLAKQSPELYYAVIGTGQMVDFLETDKYDYELVKKSAAKKET